MQIKTLIGAFKFAEKCSYSHNFQLHDDVTTIRRELFELRRHLKEEISELAAIKVSNRSPPKLLENDLQLASTLPPRLT